MRLRLTILMLGWVLPLAADPGFFPPTAKVVPKKIADATRGSFRAFFFREKPHAVVAAESIPLLKTMLKEKPLEAMDRLGLARDGLLAKLVAKDVDALPADSSYNVHIGGVGTAFILAPGWLVTARHVLREAALPKAYYDAAKAADARTALAGWKGRVVLVDAAGTVRFDSASGKQRLDKVAFSGHPAELDALPGPYAAIEKSAKLQLVDVVAFTLKGFDTKDLDVPLGTAEPKAGDALYAVGYPLRTVRNGGDSAPDADGVSLRVAHGKAFLDAPADYQKFLKTIMEDDPRKLYEKSLVYSDADFVPGLSGGAYLDAEGAAVSLASTVRHDPKLSPYERYSVTASYGPRLALLVPLFAKD